MKPLNQGETAAVQLQEPPNQKNNEALLGQGQEQEQEETGGVMDMPATLEAVRFMKTGQLQPEETREVPDHSTFRLHPFKSKLYTSQNLPYLKTIHRARYDRHRYLLKRAEEANAFLLKKTRELEKQLALLTK